MKLTVCKDCGKPIDKRAVRCRACRVGDKAPGYKDGNSLVDKRCVDCGKKIRFHAERCKSCAGKKRVFTLESRLKIGRAVRRHPITYRLFRKQIRECKEYIQWRSGVFERDNWTCQTCNIRGGCLEAHHIKEFEKIIREFGISTIEEAIKCKELWDLDIGVTLCKDCHKLTKRGRK